MELGSSDDQPFYLNNTETVSTDQLKATDLRSLGDNVKLLAVIQNLSHELVAKSENVYKKLDDVQRESEINSVAVKNLINEFQALADSQFIENRIYDEDTVDLIKEETIKNCPVEPGDNKKCPPDQKILPIIHECISNSLKFIDENFNIPDLQTKQSVESDEEEDYVKETLSKAYESNPFNRIPLPAVIGSQEFYNQSIFSDTENRALDSNGEYNSEPSDDLSDRVSNDNISDDEDHNLFTVINETMKEPSAIPPIRHGEASLQSDLKNEETDSEDEFFSQIKKAVQKPHISVRQLPYQNNSSLTSKSQEDKNQENTLSQNQSSDESSDDDLFSIDKHDRGLNSTLQKTEVKEKNPALVKILPVSANLNDDSSDDDDLFSQIKKPEIEPKLLYHKGPSTTASQLPENKDRVNISKKVEVLGETPDDDLFSIDTNPSQNSSLKEAEVKDKGPAYVKVLPVLSNLNENSSDDSDDDLFSQIKKPEIKPKLLNQKVPSTNVSQPLESNDRVNTSAETQVLDETPDDDLFSIDENTSQSETLKKTEVERKDPVLGQILPVSANLNDDSSDDDDLFSQIKKPEIKQKLLHQEVLSTNASRLLVDKDRSNTSVDTSAKIQVLKETPDDDLFSIDTNPSQNSNPKEAQIKKRGPAYVKVLPVLSNSNENSSDDDNDNIFAKIKKPEIKQKLLHQEVSSTTASKPKENQDSVHTSAETQVLKETLDDDLFSIDTNPSQNSSLKEAEVKDKGPAYVKVLPVLSNLNENSSDDDNDNIFAKIKKPEIKPRHSINRTSSQHNPASNSEANPLRQTQSFDEASDDDLFSIVKHRSQSYTRKGTAQKEENSTSVNVLPVSSDLNKNDDVNLFSKVKKPEIKPRHSISQQPSQSSLSLQLGDNSRQANALEQMDDTSDDGLFSIDKHDRGLNSTLQKTEVKEKNPALVKILPVSANLNDDSSDDDDLFSQIKKPEIEPKLLYHKGPSTTASQLPENQNPVNTSTETRVLSETPDDDLFSIDTNPSQNSSLKEAEVKDKGPAYVKVLPVLSNLNENSSDDDNDNIFAKIKKPEIKPRHSINRTSSQHNPASNSEANPLRQTQSFDEASDDDLFSIVKHHSQSSTLKETEQKKEISSSVNVLPVLSDLNENISDDDDNLFSNIKKPEIKPRHSINQQPSLSNLNSQIEENKKQANMLEQIQPLEDTSDDDLFSIGAHRGRGPR